MNYLDTFLLARDVHYEHEPKVLPFRSRADAKLQARCSAVALEEDRLATKTDAQLDAEYLRLVTQEAWDAFMKCVRERTAWDDKVNAAHKRWWDLSAEMAKVKT